MNRNWILTIFVIATATACAARADVVTDWNATIQEVMQGVPSKANPGLATRAIAMMNGAIYDVFQSFDRTHQPFLVRNLAPPTNANLDAAVAQAAHDVLVSCYDEKQADLDTLLANRLAAIGASEADKQAGANFGAAVAQHYIDYRANDHSNDMVQYTGPGGIGHWQPDALHPDQEAWGPGWGSVNTWMLPNSSYVAVPGPPALETDAYRDAYDEVKSLGELNSATRTAAQTAVGLFWGYDRASMGPPPVMFNSNLTDIANQSPNTPAENARMFAMASVAMADAAIAAWDVKFDSDFWRPITAIRAGDLDGNDNTAGDADWVPLGAPGDDPNDPNDPTPGAEDDFTPPFPSYVSGHATMGGAVFKSIELFFGTNNFGDVVGIPGAQFTLNSAEAGSGASRTYDRFSQYAALAPGAENSPDGENGMSRIYLGIHWIFDQQDGMDLGHAIAGYVAANHFLAVPEPSCLALLLTTSACVCSIRRRRP